VSVQGIRDAGNIPKHVSIIMDGNGRWASERLRPRVFGHHKGARVVRQVVETSCKLGVKYLTLYAFSEENWRRPSHEIETLMALLERYLIRETPHLNKHGVRLNAVGNLNKLPKGTQQALQQSIDALSDNQTLTLTLCLSYGGRQEILDATQSIARDVRDGNCSLTDITAELFSSRLKTGGLPDPDLMIRTSGEQRLSNFLLWEHAYSEFYFASVNWPDFSEDEYLKAIHGYQQRQRRFGLAGEQSLPLTEAEMAELETEDN